MASLSREDMCQKLKSTRGSDSSCWMLMLILACGFTTLSAHTSPILSDAHSVSSLFPWLMGHSQDARRQQQQQQSQQIGYTSGEGRHLLSIAANHTGSGAASGDKLATRCRHTLGEWCMQFNKQVPAAPMKPPPRGSKACKANCNNVGNCNYDIGICQCPAGWTGDDCTTPYKRPCTDGWRDNDSNKTRGYVDENGRDLDWTHDGWTASRCAGVCDVDVGSCWCDGKYGRINAPPGSPAGTPPVRVGRPLGDWLKPKTTLDGKRVPWGSVDVKLLYGATGWCDADSPTPMGCAYDGLYGNTCQGRHETLCLNQCSGHGECQTGFCKCHAGWYGTDCSRKHAAQEVTVEEERAMETRPWLEAVAVPPPAASLHPPADRPRLRPFIYVYDMDPAFDARMLQYRMIKNFCSYRAFRPGNGSEAIVGPYSVEYYMHEALLQSEHRTFDPEEADFFYVPMYYACYAWPILGWADAPWFPAPSGGRRPVQAVGMWLEALAFIRRHFPFWDRRGGRDHVWLAVHDEGACYMPDAIYNTSIVLTHWGRMELNHTSNTAYSPDVYSEDLPQNRHKAFKEDWRLKFGKHVCYDPKKDLVIPGFKPPLHYGSSTILGSAPQERSITAFLMGDVGLTRLPNYSRGIRQKLNTHAEKEDWGNKHQIWIRAHGKGAIPGHVGRGYSDLLSRSVFGIVVPGDGFSMRLEDAILHGCIPVIIMDNVHAVFESIIDYSLLSIRVKEADVPRLPQILGAIGAQQRTQMQQAVKAVQHRFLYGTTPLIRRMIASQRSMHGAVGSRFPFMQDAFHTILQWLHGRINATR